MHFIQHLILLSLLLLTNLTSTYANPTTAALKLGDLLFNEKLLKNTLKGFNIPDAEAIRLSRYARISVNSLTQSRQQSVKNNKELISYIKNLNAESSLDPSTKIKTTDILNASLNKNVDKMSKDDLIRTLSNLYYVAGISGKNIMGVCATCNKETPLIPGLDFIITETNSSTTKNLFTKMINSKDPDILSKDVSGMLRSLGIKDSNLAPIDERPMALFLALKESGSPAQSAYVNAVMQLSQTSAKRNGDREFGDLLEHRLWNNQDLFDNNEFLPEWTKLIQEVSAYKKRTKYSVEKSWEDTLTIRAGHDVDKNTKLQSLLKKGCFMKPK